MHNTDIMVEVVSAKSTSEAKPEFMSMPIDKNFSTKMWLLGMQAKIANLSEAAEWIKKAGGDFMCLPAFLILWENRYIENLALGYK